MAAVMVQIAAAVRRAGRTLHELLLLSVCTASFTSQREQDLGELHFLSRHQAQELDSQNMSYKQKDNEDERRKVHQRQILAWQATCWNPLTFTLKAGMESGFGSTSSFADPRFVLAEARRVQEKDELSAADE